MNKDRILTFTGTLEEIQKQYNEFTDAHENIEVMETLYLPIRERRRSTMSKDFTNNENTSEVIDTDYNFIIRYMETEKDHINRVTKGSGIGVS